MADLEAEMARFEAEVASVSGAAGAGPPHEAPRYGGYARPPPMMRPFPGMADTQQLQAPPVLMPLPPPQFRPQLMGRMPGAAYPRPPDLAGPSYAPMPHGQAPMPGFAGRFPPGAAGAGYAPRPPQGAPAPAPPPYLPGPPPFTAQQAAPCTSYYAGPPAGSQPPPLSGGGAQYAAAAKQYAAPAASLAAPLSAPAGMSAEETKKAAQAALDGMKAAVAKDAKKKPPAVPRKAGGEVWWDTTLAEWPPNDFRIFVGDMGNEVNDDVLTKAFQKYASFAKAKIVRDKHSNKSKGYGFVSLTDPIEGASALREMNGKYIGNRPCKLRKSNWAERTNEQALRGKRKGAAGGIQATLKKHHGVLHK